MKLRSFLYGMYNEYQGNFMSWVAEDILDSTEENDEDTLKHMENISLYGGVSGAITSLIYYHDINKVFKNYFEDILEYLNDKDIVITDLTVDNLVWTCYELIVDDILAQYEQQQEEVE